MKELVETFKELYLKELNKIQVINSIQNEASELNKSDRDYGALLQELDYYRNELHLVKSSTSWKLIELAKYKTKPIHFILLPSLRFLKYLLRKQRTFKSFIFNKKLIIWRKFVFTNVLNPTSIFEMEKQESAKRITPIENNKLVGLLNLFSNFPQMESEEQLDSIFTFVDNLEQFHEKNVIAKEFNELDLQLIHEIEALKVLLQIPRITKTCNNDIWIVDGRCLQDINFQGRGIGRVTKNLIEALEISFPFKRIYFFVDWKKPLNDFLKQRINNVLTRGLSPEISNGFEIFIQSSPMTHDLAPILPLLLNSRKRVSIIYDLIPATYPNKYLTNQYEFLKYKLNLHALRSYDHFLSISEVTKVKHEQCLSILPSQISNIGIEVAPLSDQTSYEEIPQSLNEKYILCPTGSDPRKNFDLCLIAYAITYSKMSDSAPQLVYIGELATPYIVYLTNLSIQLGLKPDKLLFLNRVSDTLQKKLYKGALISIIPSIDEGFSLPVVESIKSGCPVICSNISCHIELMHKKKWWHFDPNKPKSVAHIILKAVKNRDSLLAEQEKIIGKRFDRTTIRGKIKKCFEDLLSDGTSSDSSIYNEKNLLPKLKIMTPWPPDHSGIADFNYYSLSSLSRFFDVTILTNQPNPELLEGFNIRPLNLKEIVSPTPSYLLAIVGNSHFHKPIIDMMKIYKSHVIVHDTRMIEYYSFFSERDQLNKILNLSASHKSIEYIINNLDETPNLGFSEVASLTDKIMVHDTAVGERIAKETGVKVSKLPYPPYFRPNDLIKFDTFFEKKSSARKKLQLDINRKVVLCTGILDIRTKCADLIIEAFNWVCMWNSNVDLHFVGSAPEETRSALLNLVDEKYLNSVFFKGRVEKSQLCEWYSCADVCLQLRSSSILSLSGGVLDSISFGCETIMNQSLGNEFKDMPNVHLIPDKFSPIIIANAIHAVLNIPDSNDRYKEIEEVRINYLNKFTNESYAESIAKEILEKDFSGRN